MRRGHILVEAHISVPVTGVDLLRWAARNQRNLGPTGSVGASFVIRRLAAPDLRSESLLRLMRRFLPAIDPRWH